MQCVAEGGVYVGGAVGALQVLKVRARAARRRPPGAPVPDPDAVAAAGAVGERGEPG
jgi:hypothetical protein